MMGLGHSPIQDSDWGTPGVSPTPGLNWDGGPPQLAMQRDICLLWFPAGGLSCLNHIKLHLINRMSHTF